MFHKAENIIEDARWMMRRADPKTYEGRQFIRRLLRIIEAAEGMSEDISDLECEVDFLRGEVGRQLPYLPDDFE